MKHLKTIFLCLTAIILGAACSDSDSSTPIESITLNKETLTLRPDETETLTATVIPDHAARTIVTWSSSNNSVATIGADGKVTAIAVGTTTITATVTDKSATCAVTITDAILINTNEELQTAIEEASTNMNQPTKLILGAGFNANIWIDFDSESPVKYVELDGGGHTLTRDGIIFDSYTTSLKLTNITLENNFSFYTIFCAPSLTLGSGTTIKNLDETGFTIIVNPDSQLITEEGSSINGKIVLATNRNIGTKGGAMFYKGGSWTNAIAQFQCVPPHQAASISPIKLSQAFPSSCKVLLLASGYYVDANTFPETGITLVEGDGTYQLTNSDFSKFHLEKVEFGNASSPGYVGTEDCNLILDTNANAIKLKLK